MNITAIDWIHLGEPAIERIALQAMKVGIPGNEFSPKKTFDLFIKESKGNIFQFAKLLKFDKLEKFLWLLERRYNQSPPKDWVIFDSLDLLTRLHLKKNSKVAWLAYPKLEVDLRIKTLKNLAYAFAFSERDYYMLQKLKVADQVGLLSPYLVGSTHSREKKFETYPLTLGFMGAKEDRNEIEEVCNSFKSQLEFLYCDENESREQKSRFFYKSDIFLYDENVSEFDKISATSHGCYCLPFKIEYSKAFLRETLQSLVSNPQDILSESKAGMHKIKNDTVEKTLKQIVHLLAETNSETGKFPEIQIKSMGA